MKILILLVFSPTSAAVMFLSFLLIAVFWEVVILNIETFRCVERFQEVFFDALFLVLIWRIPVPDRDSVSLDLCPHLNTSDGIWTLKLVSNESEEQVLPEPVWVSFLNPDVPSPAIFVLFVLPHWLNVLLEQVVTGSRCYLVRTKKMLVDCPKVFNLKNKRMKLPSQKWRVAWYSLWMYRHPSCRWIQSTRECTCAQACSLRFEPPQTF